MSRIGSKLRELRKKRGISQEDLAKVLGVTKSTISKYELGQRELSADQLSVLLNYFGVEAGLYLVDLDDEENEDWNNYVLDSFYHSLFQNQASNTDESKDEKQLIEAYNRLNKAGKQIAIERVKELSEIPKYQKKDPQ